MRRDPRNERVGKRYFRVILLLFTSLSIIALVWFGWMVAAAFPSERTTIIASTDPLTIHSWDDTRRILTVVSVPQDIRIEGAFGVGVLPVGSLARLEAMDKTKKGILARSLAQTLGTPIHEGVLTPLSRVRFYLVTRTIRPDAVKNIDLDALGVYRQEQLPDGTTVRVFDMNRFDALNAATFEIDSVRREELRVRVVNTTDTRGVGSRVARTVGIAGMVVVAVESEGPSQTDCTIVAKKIIWSTTSVGFLRQQYGCVLSEEGLDERVDVTLRLGTKLAEDFFLTRRYDESVSPADTT